MIDWKTMARKLIETQELDPVYTVLARAVREVGGARMARLCMYYIMFYDLVGAVGHSYFAGDHFWDGIETYLDTLKRGQERRHNRGALARRCLQSLRAFGSPEEAFLSVASFRDYRGACKHIEKHFVNFGPYFQLKWVDLINNVFQGDIDMEALQNNLPKGSEDGLKAIWPGRPPALGLMEIRNYIKQFDDPFTGTRKCDWSEAETVACGVKVYCVNTTFKFGWDIRHLHNSLYADTNNPLLIKLRKYLPDYIPEPK